MNRSRLKRPFRAMLTLVAATALVASAAAGATPDRSGGAAKRTVYELKYADANPPSDTSPMTQFAKYFTDRISKLTNGQVHVTYYPNSQLGPNPQMLSGVLSGSIDMASITSGTIATINPKFLLFSLPFLVTSHAQQYRLFASKPAQTVLQGLKAQGATGLAYMDNGPFVLLTRHGPIRKPSDLKGMKIRTVGDPAQDAMLKEVGAQPVALNFPEVYTSLQQGVIDGVLVSPSAILAASLYQVAKNVAMVIPSWVSQPVFISNKTLESLPPNLQKAVIQAGKDAQKFAEDNTKNILANAIQQLRSAGAHVETHVNVAAFQKAMVPVYAAFKDQIGAKLLSDARNAVVPPKKKAKR